ncbi:hypothetical protein Godav_013555 [Gossypium davidsonii]|uniref:AIG1-type G domain-containing protein n=1 Tax=Gossypium davidsonii TaxID=34287 RepID=A0A7J8RH21_GOSDV|nr:hypothetical protein [Gossypium davidsonii]
MVADTWVTALGERRRWPGDAHEAGRGGPSIDIAKDGIHAVAVVFSLKTRFSKEEKTAFQCLETLFGTKIFSYIIIVFTNGDALEEDVTLKDYLDDSPQPLKDVLLLCGHRFVLFDNKTEDKTKRGKQVDDLVSLANMVIAQNGGQPYYDELGATTCDEQEEVASLKGYIKQEICKEQIERLYEKLLMRISELVIPLSSS